MNSRRNQNSILVLTTLGVYLGLILVGATPPTAAQSLLRVRPEAYRSASDVDDSVNPGKSGRCSVSQDDRAEEAKYLWFNRASVYEYVRLLRDILDAYSEEQVDQAHLVWRAPKTKPPFGDLDSTGSDSLWIPVDAETKSDMERDILALGNGFTSGKWFQLSVDRGPSDFISQLAVNISGTDGQTAQSLYSGAVQNYACGRGYATPSYFEKIALDRTEVSIENDNLVITTRLPRGSLYALLPAHEK